MLVPYFSRNRRSSLKERFLSTPRRPVDGLGSETAECARTLGSRRREELRGFGSSLSLGLPTSASCRLGARACHHRGPHTRAAKRSFIGSEAIFGGPSMTASDPSFSTFRGFSRGVSRSRHPTCPARGDALQGAQRTCLVHLGHATNG